MLATPGLREETTETMLWPDSLRSHPAEHWFSGCVQRTSRTYSRTMDLICAALSRMSSLPFSQPNERSACTLDSGPARNEVSHRVDVAACIHRGIRGWAPNAERL